jgi:phosphohistidine phosphatase
MTRTLLVLRHAKSSWKEAGLSDHDRPLNNRGKRDAPRVGRLLDDEDLVPDAIVASTATRAHATAHAVAEHCTFDGAIVTTPDLYHAHAEAITLVVRDLPDHAGRAMIVGHNPGLEEFVVALTGASVEMPTSALAHVDFEIESWRDVTGGASAELVRLWRVRELPKD